MTAIAIRSFGGIAPRLNPRYLPDNRAQTATNVDTSKRGSLVAVKDVGSSTHSFPAAVKSIARYEDNDTYYWVGSQNRASWAKSQLTNDNQDFMFLTIDENNTTRPPLFSFDDHRASSAPQTALYGLYGFSAYYGLGVPAPSAAPTVTLRSQDSGGADQTGGITELEAAGKTKEFRSYVTTYVWTVGGREMESAPSPASDSVGVFLESSEYLRVSLPTSLPTYPTDYGISGSPIGMLSSAVKVRLYRSVGGSFLLVNTTGDFSLTNGSYDDTTLAEDLGEELPSLTWGLPPRDLKGLTNMSNGIVAGFSGRDIYFSEPYITHAWPVSYVISVDSPIVGLASLDTTLVVLTRERPYYIQGSSPEFLTLVEADADQGCISVDSIATLNGEVYYASPDGLIATSPRGTRIVTEALFSYSDWNSTFNISTIKGFTHDLKYFGFSDSLDFILDIPTGELTTFSLPVRAAATDYVDDTLYVVLTDNTVCPWGEGSNLTYTWKSKKFGLPGEVSFSAMQVEAESYNLTAKLYADGSLIHTQTVTSREAFRLPARLARDWEIELTGTVEVYNVAIAQSITELAGA